MHFLQRNVLVLAHQRLFPRIRMTALLAYLPILLLSFQALDFLFQIRLLLLGRCQFLLQLIL